MSEDEDSMHDDEEREEDMDDHIDENTLRVMVSTDNHLGYAERDPVRGLDSFAAFEEVLMLAKRHKCDMVLLAGDLFHDNKPSRRTMHKTMEIIRRYCMGPDPVQFQIVSNQTENFRSVHGTVNYEDQYYSVDLPIFSIHGNHDDPTRDGGTEMLAALDLLAVSNLVNYFGRQDEVDKVEVSPVLIQKGTTRVALYGMGSMRDERLNRMWQSRKVRFLQPEKSRQDNDDDDDDEEENGNGNDQNSDQEEDGNNGGWFNIFALHQNRDLGRGSKNCVHESMIPEWMDLVVWGHEHECQIHPTESAVGTYRITQPGSSVATSLTSGEALRKHVGILDVRESQFRMRAIPLSQVRAFAMGELSLQSQPSLDPEDPHVDDKVTTLLANEVERLIEEARESSRALLQDAETAASAAAENLYSHRDDDLDAGGNSSLSSSSQARKLNFQVQKTDQVLIRLKVEHSGFTTLNNQRFGSRFVNEVANPSDILLFHRRRTPETSKSENRKGGKNASSSALDTPIAPEDLAEINVEDLVKDTLEMEEKKMELLDEQRLGIALEDFVSKEQKQSITETVDKIVNIQQNKLVKRGVISKGSDDEGGEESNKITTATAVREVCAAETERTRKDAIIEADEEDEKKALATRRKWRQATNEEGDNVVSQQQEISIDSDSDGDSVRQHSGKRRRMAMQTKASSSKANTNGTKNSRRKRVREMTDDESDDDVVASSQSVSRARPGRRATATKKRYTYNDNDDDDFEQSKSVDDDSGVEIVETPIQTTKRGRGRGRGKASTSSTKQQKLSLTPLETSTSYGQRRRRTNASTRNGRKSYYEEESDDDEGVKERSQGRGWGTASQSSRRSQR